ncbi:MAG: enoyl-CoA hydratase/isomerase family protein [Proteobacteria bacterium]|nr:enoyl-CoA hydratase/isomerase family protein [Pseudomonadota bacterium]
MELETVIYEKKDRIGLIRLNRPQVLNAQNRQLVRDFLTALKAVEADTGVRAVIIMGEGRAFCSGDDLSEEHDLASMEEGLKTIETLQETTRVLMRLPKPVIAAVHGYALGAGCEWAMNCDIRIAAEGTQFGFPETSVGMTVTNAGTKMLPLLIGLARAKELVFTAERIDAEQAERWGLVNRVVPLEMLEETTLEMAGKIIRNSFLALALSKKAMNQGVYLGFEDVLERETQDIALVIQTIEAAERSRAALAETKK